MNPHSTSLSSLLRLTSAALLSACLLAASAVAGTLFSADFKSAEEGKRPPGFRLVNGGDAEMGVSKGEVRFTKSSRHLLAVSEEPSLAAAADYTVTTRLRFGSGNDIWGGVVARLRNDGSFYHARIYTLKDGKAELQLYRVGGPGTLLLGKDEFDIRTGVVMTLALTVKGSTQQAVLTDRSGNRIATISASDAAYINGPAGMRAMPKGSVVVFESFTVTTED
ncbi:hypothetical protein OPIT5_10105 [Opitutaceae bacterium TAV5]|nr:hypothetical protein OPIT5_10105 [Opitutaceae bacterium TAV5]